LNETRRNFAAVNRFQINDSFAVSPDTFVFAGTIIEGEAKVGMTFEVPEAGHRRRAVVRAVEFADSAGGVALIGLCVHDENYPPGLR